MSVQGLMEAVSSVLKIASCIVIFVLLGALALAGSLFVFGSFFFETMRPSLVDVVQHIGLFVVGVLMISIAVYGGRRFTIHVLLRSVNIEVLSLSRRGAKPQLVPNYSQHQE